MEINANYKDSVFTSRFNDPALLRELHCALWGVTMLTDATLINTPEKAHYQSEHDPSLFALHNPCAGKGN